MTNAKRTPVTCGTCNGTGKDPRATCDHCFGTGKISDHINNSESNCSYCEGNGFFEQKCRTCNGSGKVVPQTITEALSTFVVAFLLICLLGRCGSGDPGDFTGEPYNDPYSNGAGEVRK
jgi:RecJ-like exonuclease